MKPISALRALGDRNRAFEERSLQERVLLSQLPFAICVLVVFLVTVALGPSEPLSESGMLFGVGLTAVLTVLAGAVPWDKLPRASYWIIPLLDFVAAAPIWDYSRYMLDGMVLLAAFPVIWLAWSGLYPRAAILLGFLGSAFVSWWPYISDLQHLTDAQLVRPAVVPVFMVSLGITASVLNRSMERQQEQVTETLRVSRQQTRRLETVLDTSSVGIVVTDRHGNDILVNPTQKRFHRHGLPEGVDDAPEADLIQFEADGVTPIQPEHRVVARAVRGENFHDELLVLGRPPGQRTLSVSAQAMLDDDGEFDGTVVAFQDITDLIEAFRARERFIADVSHEFRTPLTSIIGYLEFAQNQNQDPAVATYLSTIHRNAERLLVLVTSLLEAAANDDDLALRDNDLVDLIRHCSQSAMVRARSVGIRLVTNLPESLRVVVDGMKISQIIDNLISNAIKYTGDGGLVSVSARADGDWAELVVADTGIGMSAEDLDRVFDGFFRAEQVRRAGIPGTGLGLSLSKRMVEAHGGSIDVQSECDVGTTITVRLPVEPGLVEPPRSPASPGRGAPLAHGARLG